MRALRLMLACFLAVVASPACAQIDLVSPATVSASFDLRFVAANGEKSWIDGGFGKGRWSARSDGVQPAEAALIWQPRFGWAVSGTVVATAQHGQDRPIDLSEAFLTWKPMPHGNVRLGGRAGLMWPAISLEHSGPEWSVTDTITPSAINSWVGDEVKVAAVEGSATVSLGAHRIAATAAIFAFDDTAGTLIALRGWALHDEKATAFSLQPLPPLDPFLSFAQAKRTRPILELDHRPGFYGKLAWDAPGGLHVELFTYDNRGNPEAVRPTLQWGWDTRFTDIGVRLPFGGQRWELRAQGMAGNTRMGFPMPTRIWIDTDFRSTYGMLTRRWTRGSASVRAEWFGTRNNGSVVTGQEDEDGWAMTGAVRRDLGHGFTALAEVLHIESTRGSRVFSGERPLQYQNFAQLALRLKV